MRRFFCLFILLGAAAAQVIPGGGSSTPASTITGAITTSTGGAIKAGTLTFTLSQPAVASGTGSIVTQVSSCYTSNSGNIVGLPDPQVLPVVTTNTSSGSMTAGTYYVQIYYTNASTGVSAVSPEIAVTLTSTGSLIVHAPTFQPSSANGYGVAIGTTSGAESIQGTVTGWTQFTQSLAPSTGNPPPATNNSSCNVWFSDALIPTGTYYTVNLLNKNSSQVSGFPQTWCTYGGANGTIDVSQGAPTGNCNTKGVFYPTPIFSNPPSLSQSVAGKLNLSGALASTGTIGVTNTGTFTDDQMHQYLTSFIGGISPSFYRQQGLSDYTTEAATFGIAIPSNAATHEGVGVVGMVSSTCNSLSRTQCNGVAVAGHAQAQGAGAAVWGGNMTVSDTPAATNANLVGNEFDIGVGGNPAWVHGVDIFLDGSGSGPGGPVNYGTVPSSGNAAAAIDIDATSQAINHGTQWTNAIYIDGAAISSAGNAIWIDKSCGSASPCASKPITIVGYDGTTAHFTSITADAHGNITAGTAIAAGGTQAGITGTGACATTSNQAGGSWAGNVKCTGTTGASTLTITPGTTAPAGWHCSGSDNTSGHELAGSQSGGSATSCTLKFSSVTANDFIDFGLTAF